MALRSVISSRIPIVIILGATGTGKTKLSVELAQKFGSEIISADSMQIYKGMDIVTAKASPQERSLAPHHLLDILEPHQFFTVVDFRNRALKIIDNLTEQNKCPIVVGGTIYYIESIVYQILVEDTNDTEVLLWDKSRRKRDLENSGNIDDNKKTKETTETNVTDIDVAANKEEVDEQDNTDTAKDLTAKTNEGAEADAIDNTGPDTEEMKKQLQEFVDNEARYTNMEIYEKLKSLDPAMTNRLHPNNRRKILRSMEVWLKTGRLHSEILEAQKVLEGRLRKPDSTIIFWLKCDQDILDKRLDARVDSMLEDGLIQELLEFHEKHNKERLLNESSSSSHYTKGIFQTLGFKEFHDYLVMSEEERNSEAGQKLLKDSIENMKLATRRYSKRQNKMIRLRFLEHPRREIPLIYELDTTDVSKWDENVKNKATEIIESYVENKTSAHEPIKSKIETENQSGNEHSYNYCEICDRIFLSENVYNIHLKSYKHKRVLKRKMLDKKKAENSVELKLTDS